LLNAGAYAADMSVTVSIEKVIDAPLQRVWDDVADLASHVEWMADAESITFLTDQRSGAGTTMEVLTRVGPLKTTDIMEFTEWEPPHRMAIRHKGLITGIGSFNLESDGDATRFIWAEDLSFPWYLCGTITATIAAPVLKLIWRRNLKALAARF
jgi:carbon monoxide dehydrogenase subunit G